MKKNIFSYLAILLIIILLVYIVIFFTNQNPREISAGSYEAGTSRGIKDIGEFKAITTNIWLHEEKRLDRITNNDIKYLFVDVGDINIEGKLITSEKDITRFLGFIEDYEKENNIDFILLPYNEIILSNYDLSSLVFRNNVINNHKYLIELGFDGVLIDIEAIPHEFRQTYLDFLEKLDKEINKQNIICVYAGAIDESPNVWEWENEFYIEVANRVDIISVPSYDFNFNSEKEYKNYLTQQLKSINELELKSNLIFTVPTHKPFPETTENSLKTFELEISKHPNNQFIGITYFAEWTTSDEEWQIIENYNF